MKLKVLLTTVVASAALCSYAQTSIPKYLDQNAPIEERVEDALSRMTLKEKLAVIHAQSKFSSAGVPNLGIPEIWTSDGPHGIRAEVLWDDWKQAKWTSDSCMAFPALTCLAASWNLEMSRIYGVAIGEEARYRGKDVLLGPGVNIYRTPLNGRNFEYMGEDPYLAAQMVVPYVEGVQSNGVAACVKHYALNNQEFNRHTTNVTLSDRALYEIYLPAFKAAVQEGEAWAMMGSYNLYNGQHGTYNERLIEEILRGEWDFDGVVISDWGATHNTEQAAKYGLDMEFGSHTDGMSHNQSNAYSLYYLANPYYDMIESGEIGTEELDNKVRNVLRLAMRTVMQPSRPFGSFASEVHGQVARKIAEDGMVLLKNDNALLPIVADGSTKILVVGENAIKMLTVGGGSSSLKAKYEISPLDGITTRAANEATITYARGYVGSPKVMHHGAVIGTEISDDRTEEELTKEAVELAKDADYVIYIGGLNKDNFQDSEGHDRTELKLPYNQDNLIAKLAEVTDKLVVVNISGNAVEMPWVDDVESIVQAWYSGSQAGTALASILFGDVNPSGKLPFSFLKKLSDNGAHALGTYPGTDVEVPQWRAEFDTVNVEYKEGIYVGYRWLDEKKIEPLFAFGHGLSYTTFEYSSLTLSAKEIKAGEPLTLTVDITNTGDRAGSEVVQLYISDLKSSLPRPVKELKGFDKINLAKGETKQVTLTIKKEDLSFFDDTKHEWVLEAGTFEVLVGSSSDDIRTKAKFKVK